MSRRRRSASSEPLEPRLLLAFTAVTVDAANSGDVKAFADVDRDGHGDIILGGDSLSWYRYNSGTWTKHVIRAAPIYQEYTTDMQAGDIDGDGDPDIVVGDGSGTGNVLVFWNPGPTGDPTDGASWAVRVIGTHGSWAHDIEIGDINNDDFVDVVTSGHGITHIWLQRPGAWPTTWQDKNLSALAGEGLALDDIDGDGDLDIATPEAWLETPAIAFLSDPTAYTWTRHVITGAASETATTGDFNNDGRPDIATILQHANGKFAWYEQPADPRSANWPEHVIDNSQGSHKLVAADFNNDGLLDLMTGLELARINIYTNQGGASPSFSNQQILNTGGHNARAGDIGNDGDIDIISCDYIGHPPLRVLINDRAPVANVPPKVTLRSPASQQMPDPGPLTLAANAWDGDGTIERVEFYTGNQLIWTEWLAPYSISWTLTPGTHQFRARAYDNFGAFTDSAVMTVEVGGAPLEAQWPQLRPRTWEFSVSFTKNVSASLAASDLVLTNLDDAQNTAATSLIYDTSYNYAKFTLPALGDGLWRASLAAADVTDAGGQPLAAPMTFDFLVISGTPGDDDIRLRRAGDAIEVFVNAALTSPTRAVPLASISSWVVRGGAGEDEMVLDLAGGNPWAGESCAFLGGEGGDLLRVLGSDGDDSLRARDVYLSATTTIPWTPVLEWAEIEWVQFELGAGDDQLELSTSELPLPLFFGGSGLNTLILGADHPVVTQDLAITTSLALKLDDDADFAASQHLRSLVLVRSTLRIQDHGQRLIRTGSIVLDNYSLLDLRDNALILDSTGTARAADYASLRNWIISARAGGEWTGKGISTSLGFSGGLMGVGLLLNDNGAGSPIHGTLLGESLDANSIVARATWVGDANLDFRVDIDDYFAIDNGYAKSPASPRYQDGDFNYSGGIDADDYYLIDHSFIAQGEAGAPPTIETAPHVVSSTPTTVTLSALAADDGGESNLIYTWEILSGFPVTFSDNNSNAAKQTLATFSHWGDYTFRVTIRDPGGRSAAATIDVQVDLLLTAIWLLPETTTLAAGASRQFDAWGISQFGVDYPLDTWAITPNWSVESGPGTISADGVYTAPAGGAGSAVVRVSAGVFSDTAAITLTDESTVGLLLHYHFDEGTGQAVYDASPGENHGSVYGATWTAAGKSGAALDFDGALVYVQPAQSSFFNIPGSALTLAAWIKPDDFGETDARIISKATGTAEQDHVWMLSTIPITGGIGLRFRLKTGTNTTTLVASSGLLTAGQWAHVAATYDGMTMRLYLNGALVGSLAKTGAIASSTAYTSIGDNPGGGRAFDGLIDEVRIYSRALSQEELSSLAGS